MPISPDAELLAKQLADGSTPLDHALSDGEDFELLLAVPPEEAKRMLKVQPLNIPLTAIGEFQSAPGLRQINAAGRCQPLEPRGYEH